MAIQKITASVLGNNAVTAANVAAGALSAADIADNSITAAKISASTSPTFGGLTVNSWYKGASGTNTLYSDTSQGTIIQTPSNTNNAAGTFYIRDSLGNVHFELNTNTNVVDIAGSLDITASGNHLKFTRSSFDTLQFGTGTGNSISGLHLSNTTDSTVPFSIHENAPDGSLTVDSEGNLQIKNTADNGLTLNKQTASTWNYIEYKNQGTRSHYIGTDSAGKLTFGSDSGAIFYFTGGQVGIGEITPSTELHVKGTNNSAGDLWTQVGSGNIPSITIQNAGTTDNNNAALFFRNDSGMFAAINARFVNHTTDETELRFSTTNSSGTTRERLTIDGAGNVVIGATSASNGKLTIDSDDAGETGAGGIILNTPNSSLRIGGTNGRSWIQSHASQPLWINKEGNNVVFNYDAGNVIVGNGSGTDKFNVYGTSLLSGNTYIGTSSTLYISTSGKIQTYSGGTTYDALYHSSSINTSHAMIRIGNSGRSYPAILSGADIRTPTPADFQDSGIQCTFTSYGLNNSSPWADGIILNTYTDSSGGGSNAFLISKSGNAIKVARQGWNSTSNYSSGSIYTVDITSASDERVKENVQNITNGLELISQLRPVTFEWTDNYILAGASKNANENVWNEETESLDIPETKTTNVGLIAQEVESIIPTVIHEDRISIPGVEGNLKNIDYEKLVPHLISAIKELKERIEVLEG